MGIVSSSGISLVTSIEIVASVVGNKIAEKELLKVKEKVLKGEGLGDSIMNIKIFPPMLASMVKIGEEAGIIIGFLLISILTPMFKMYNSIS